MKKQLSKHDIPNEAAKDSINQDTDVKILDIVSYGEIEGLSTQDGRNAGASIFYNQARLNNPSGTSNIRDVDYELRTGTPDQEPITGFSTDFSMGHPTNFSSLITVGHVFNKVPRHWEIAEIEVHRSQVIIRNQFIADGDYDEDNDRQLIVYDENGNPMSDVVYSGGIAGAVSIYSETYEDEDENRNVFTLVKLLGFDTSSIESGANFERIFINYESVTITSDTPVDLAIWWVERGSDPYRLYIADVDNLDEVRFLIQLERLIRLSSVQKDEKSLTIRFRVEIYDGDLIGPSGDPKVTNTIKFSGIKHSAVEQFLSADISDQSGDITCFVTQVEYLPCGEDGEFVRYGYRGTGHTYGFTCVRSRVSYYTLVSHHTYSHPNRALIATTMQADVFSGSLPTRKFIINGIKMAVPRIGTERYDQGKRGIDPDPLGGIWLGELTDGGMYGHVSTDNPAWIVYNLVTNPDYGLGLKMNKTSVKVASDYCDQIIKLPNNDTEPRFRFNHQMNRQGEAQTILNGVLASFQAKLIQFNGEFYLEVDRPLVEDDTNLQDRIALSEDTVPIIETDDLRSSIVTNDNVINGEFTYTYKTFDEVRSTVILVSWINPDMDYNVDVVQVEADAITLDKYGRNTKKVIALGCQSRYQAQRLGRWHLSSIIYEQEVVSYVAGIDHITSHANKIIYVRDDRRGDIDDQIQARVVSHSGTDVTINKEITVDTHQRILLKGYENHDFKEDDQDSIEVEVSQEFSVTNAGDVTADLVLSATPDFNVADNSVCITYTRDSRPIPYRITDLQQAKNNQFNVSGIKYDPQRYEYIDGIHETSHQTLHVADPSKPHAPSNLRIIPVGVTYDPGSNTVTAVVTWTATRQDSRISGYEVSWQEDGATEWTVLPPVRGIQVGIPGLSTDRDTYYRFRVRTLTFRGDTSVWLNSPSRPIRGLLVVPSTPQNVGYHVIANEMSLDLIWDALPDYGLSRVEIRYSATATEWDDALPHDEQPVFSGNEGITTSARVGNFFIRVYNIFEQRSGYVTVSVGATELSVSANHTYEETGFPGVEAGLAFGFEVNDDGNLEGTREQIAQHIYQFSEAGADPDDDRITTLDVSDAVTTVKQVSLNYTYNSTNQFLNVRREYRISSSTDDDFEFDAESWLRYGGGQVLTGRYFQFRFAFSYISDILSAATIITDVNLEVLEI